MASKIQHLVPHFEGVIGNLVSANTTLADTHYIIVEYKTHFPRLYANDLQQLFNGDEKIFHSTIARMIKRSIAHHANHISNVPSRNCRGKISQNAQWQLS